MPSPVEILEPAPHSTPPSVRPGLVVGVDLGTSCSAVARLDHRGKPVLLRDSEGRDLIASAVVLGAEGRVEVGGSFRHPTDRLVTAIKRHMGRGNYSLLHEGHRLSPEMVSALILKKLSASADRHGEVASVILTVPSYFFSPGRRATIVAGRLADLPSVELLAEPTAAVLSHLWRTDPDFDRERTLLVFDLGGGTFDVSIVRATGGRLHVSATEGDNDLGGIDWTERMVRFAAEKYRRRHAADPREHPASHARLLAACEAAKCELGHAERAVFDVCHDGIRMPLGLSRGEFEQLTGDLIRRARDITEFLFESSGISPEQIDEVVLVGGGSKMPCIVEMMQQICDGKPILAGGDPQRTVAEGAAIYAAAVSVERGIEAGYSSSLRRRLREIELQDVNAHSLGIALDGPNGRPNGRNHILLPRNTPLPAVVRQRFVTSLANPEGIALRLLEGEAPEVGDCTVIGDWRITGLPADLPVHSPVQVTFRHDRQRNVTVEARELTGGADARIERLDAWSADRLDADRQSLAAFHLADDVL